ncbi:hypothetical protein EYF80_037761 [Liparis tanakae]|uniref:Uncharacterized protein n=1 Tax=Liparis tanakae TaxID=230148 RepID=A0A4Z2GER4_9TELE|nr:hypothetical protein EYF80_037761 [Liparis tanakae]
MASMRLLLSSSSLRRCMFSRSCRASLNDCRKVSKIPKNSSGCILPSSSPKCFRDLTWRQQQHRHAALGSVLIQSEVCSSSQLSQ